MEENFSCPTRMIPTGTDHWRANHECSHCGSVHPELALAMAGKGAAVKEVDGLLHVQNEIGIWRPVNPEHCTPDELKDLRMRAGDYVLEQRAKAHTAKPARQRVTAAVQADAADIKE